MKMAVGRKRMFVRQTSHGYKQYRKPVVPPPNPPPCSSPRFNQGPPELILPGKSGAQRDTPFHPNLIVVGLTYPITLLGSNAITLPRPDRISAVLPSSVPPTADIAFLKHPSTSVLLPDAHLNWNYCKSARRPLCSRHNRSSRALHGASESL